jgi:hypothetical protein
MSVKLNERDGITCGKRDNGARCVLWSDDTFEWFDGESFATLFAFDVFVSGE